MIEYTNGERIAQVTETGEVTGPEHAQSRTAIITWDNGETMTFVNFPNATGYLVKNGYKRTSQRIVKA